MQKNKPSELGHAERQHIIRFLESHPVGVLATVDADGDPHASTIYFVVDDDLKISFTTKHDTLKYKNIMHHGTVMLVAFDASGQAAVQIGGLAKEETDPTTAQKIYQGTLQAAKGTSKDMVPPIAKIVAGPYAAFTIHPQYVEMTEYGWGDSFANAIKHMEDSISTDDRHNQRY